MDSKKIQHILETITARSDVMVALLLVAITVMMILPMPTWALDILIGLNMGMSLVLLMLSVYIPTPLEFSAFPSVLLLSTLFRLSLAISSTRLILLQADAGKIIQTFGEFVVGGNLIVGLVVFLIITIVQFIVITKGTERIAEVSARFSLDAMPGKQMSIDSDMRAGVITLAEARRRRSRLENESKLYGSMDGAMKFVKGDAIAGLIIIFVNILGGLAIGSLQQGMDISSALNIYSILTIGDGLVSQIPALFVSITAGIIVTRVTVDEHSNLGEDIGKQILAQPKALIAAAGIVVAMGAVPGFPTTVFLFLGGLLGLTGFVLRKVETQPEFAEAEVTTLIGQTSANPTSPLASSQAATQALEEMQPLAPVLVELPSQVKTLFSLDTLNQDFNGLRREFYLDLGVPLPGIGLKLVAALEAETYRISIRGIPVAQGSFNPSALPANSPAELVAPNANSAAPALAVKPATPSALDIIHHHLSYLLRKHAADFIGIQEVHTLYGKMEAAGYTELVREAQRAVSTTKTVDILRRLLNEGVSIRDLRQILETLVEFGESEKDPAMLTERARINLKRQISYAYTGGKGVLSVYLLAPATEALLQGSVRQTPAGIFLALSPENSQKLSARLRELEEQARIAEPKHPIRPVVLGSMEIRRHLRKHLAAEFPDLPVLSIQELAPSVSLQALGEIRLT